MNVDLTQKIELFGQGYITEGVSFIDYDPNLLSQYHSLLTNYWSPWMEWYVQKYITSADLLEPSAAVSGEDFTMTGYVVDITDLEAESGVDFEVDLELVSPYYEEVSGDIDAYVADIIADVESEVSGVTANIVNIQNVTFSKPRQFSQGITDFVKLNCNYLDNNDTNTHYYRAYKIAIPAMNPEISGSFLNSFVKEITSKIKQESLYRFGKKVNICQAEDIYYCKLPDIILEDILLPVLSTHFSTDNALRVIKAANSMMPADESIYDNTNQNDVMRTAKALIDEIDIFARAIERKGFE